MGLIEKKIVEALLNFSFSIPKSSLYNCRSLRGLVAENRIEFDHALMSLIDSGVIIKNDVGELSVDFEMVKEALDEKD